MFVRFVATPERPPVFIAGIASHETLFWTEGLTSPCNGAKVGIINKASEIADTHKNRNRQIRKRYRRTISQSVSFYGQKCAYCHERIADSADHFVPFIFTHDNRNENLVPSCRQCNSIAGDRVFDSFAEKKSYILDQRANRAKLVPTYCPNGCGVTYARKGQTDHCPDCGAAV